MAEAGNLQPESVRDLNHTESQPPRLTSIWQGILALSPIALGLGYFMAYLYELGFCSAFGLPTELIRLQWTDILPTAGRVFITFFALFWVVFVFLIFINSARRRRWGPRKRRFVMLSLFFVIYIAFAISYPPALHEWYWMFPLFLYFVFLFFVGPLFTQRGTPGYLQKLSAQDEIDRQSPSPLDYLAKRIGWGLLGVLLMMLPLLSLPYFSGEVAAMTQEYFWVPSTNQNSVVLRVYGDNLICAQLDKQSNKLNGSFFILRLDDDPRPVLTLQKVGPLAAGK